MGNFSSSFRPVNGNSSLRCNTAATDPRQAYVFGSLFCAIMKCSGEDRLSITTDRLASRKRWTKMHLLRTFFAQTAKRAVKPMEMTTV
jgi:hypothetical protein